MCLTQPAPGGIEWIAAKPSLSRIDSHPGILTRTAGMAEPNAKILERPF